MKLAIRVLVTMTALLALNGLGVDCLNNGWPTPATFTQTHRAGTDLHNERPTSQVTAVRDGGRNMIPAPLLALFAEQRRVKTTATWETGYE